MTDEVMPAGVGSTPVKMFDADFYTGFYPGCPYNAQKKV
jgi:hypothetical protein